MRKLLKIIIVLVLIIAILFIMIKNKNTIMKKFYIIKYSEYVEKYSNEYNVDKYLIYATIKAESNFNKNAQSKKGAKGLMQLLDSTGQEIADGFNITFSNNDSFDANINIMLGTKYLSKLIQKYNNIELALAAYNAGSGNVDNWIKQNVVKEDGSDVENIPFKETNYYVRKILKDYRIYKQLYEQEG